MTMKRIFRRHLGILKGRKQLYLVFTICLFLVYRLTTSGFGSSDKSSTSSSSSSSQHTSLWNKITLQQNKKKVDKIVDLLNFKFPSSFNKEKYTSWETKDFIKSKVTGFVTNLDSSRSDYLDGQTATSCDDLKYENSLYYHVEDRKKVDNLVSVRREILGWNNKISSVVQNADLEKDKSEKEIVEKHWFEFGHMATWYEPGDCYLMYSRVIYTKGAKNLPEMSLIKATAYDKDWNEIVGKRIPLDGVVIPSNLEEELALLDEQLEFDQCKEFELSAIKYEECMKKQSQDKSESKQRKEEILKDYFITYPKVLDFEFKMRSFLAGPEDPHVILRTSPHGVQEPILIFNLDDGKDRRIYAVMPHRKNPKPVEFTLNKGNGEELAHSEKNWSPFFLPGDDDRYSQLSNGYIHFVYSYIPLRVLRCSLDDGRCDEVFSGKTLGLSPDNKDGDLRGGTQFVTLPNVLPAVKNKNIWITMAKTHAQDCGCGTHFYRGVLIVMVESAGIYHMEILSPGIDFSIEPLNFEGKGTSCDFKNIITPNSIISWDVVSKDSKTKSFEDYLTLTVSEADAVSKLVTVKGVLDYILNVYKQKEIADAFPLDGRADGLISKNKMCVAEYAARVCKEYGKKHPKN